MDIIMKKKIDRPMDQIYTKLKERMKAFFDKSEKKNMTEDTANDASHFFLSLQK